METKTTKPTKAKSAETKSRKKFCKIFAPLKAFFSKTKNKKLVTLLAIIFLTGGVLYRFRSQFIVAVVNGRPISRLTLIRELEKQAGASALDSLITKTLILQEAGKQNITISDDEVNEEIKRIEENLAKQGQDLNQLLSLQGGSQSELREQIRMQKMIEKIVGKDVEVADEEVNDYLEKNKDSLPEDMDMEEIKASVRRQLEQQKLTEKVQLWLKSLRDAAKINYLLKF